MSRLRTATRGLLLAGALVFLNPAAWGLFTGDDQFDRTHLNTESYLDPEYFLHVLSYRPFWRMAPGAAEPKAFVRTTEGSVTPDRLYTWREIGIRGAMPHESFWGYHLLQVEDLEQHYFHQTFGVQTPRMGPVALRLFGEAAGKKQNGDLGFGSVFYAGESSLSVNFSLVDLFYNPKNLDHNNDRRHPKNLLVVGQTQTWFGPVEASFENDTPVSREYRDEGTLYGYRNNTAQLRGLMGPWDLTLGWENQRQTLEPLTAGLRLQDFRKEVVVGEVAWPFAWRSHHGRLGTWVTNRRVNFTAAAGPLDNFRRNRWEADPYMGMDWPISKRMRFETTIFYGLIWEKTALAALQATNDFSVQARLATGWRIDFTPDVVLVLSPNWDLDKLFTASRFDGGNAQLQAKIF